MDDSKALKSTSFSYSPDGRSVEISFHRKDGSVARIQCPFDSLSHIVTEVEKAQGKAWEMQREFLGGVDPRNIYPVRGKTVIGIDGGVTSEEVKEITFVLASGARLSLALDKSAMERLNSLLAQLGSYDPPTPRRDN